MEFWLKDEAQKIDFLLPVTPKSYSIPYGNMIETVSTVEGDVNIPTSKRLATVKIEGFFTTNDYPFRNKITYHVSNAMGYVDLIKSWIDKKSVIRLTITKDKVTKVSLLFIVEEITHSETDGSGDIYYTIVLREPRANDKSKNNSSSTTKRETPSKDNKVNKTYTVMKGDYLGKIARRFYGNCNLWTKIHEANKSKIKNPNILAVGQKLTIP